MKKILKTCLAVCLMVFLSSSVALAADMQKSVTPEAPVIRSVTAVSGTKIAVNWNAASGADRYRVYIKQGNSSWKTLADVTATSYSCSVDSSSWGNTVQIKIRSINSETGRTTLSQAGSVVMKPGKVKVTSVSPVDCRTNKISWKVLSGAQCYKLYRKGRTGGWKYLGTIHSPSTSSYQDRTATGGEPYYYTVRACWKQENKVQDGVVDGKGLFVRTNLQTPTVSAQRNEKNVIVSWSRSTNAEGYRIYRKENNSSSYKAMVNVSPGSRTSWTDTSARSGVKYIYTVKAYARTENGLIWSDYNRQGATVKEMIDTPVLKNVQQVGGTVRISWDKVKNASYYDVYKKTSSNASWKKIKRTSSNFLSLTNWKSTDYYTVVAGQGSLRSGYDRQGIEMRYLPKAPRIIAAYGTDGNTVIHWEAQNIADAYYVYRKTGNSGWQQIRGLPGCYNVTAYDTKTRAGDQYRYTIRARRIERGITYLSAYNNTGTAVKVALGEPVLKSLTYTKGQKGWTLTWTKVQQAKKYYVYKKKGNGWSMLGQTEGNSFCVSTNSNDKSVYTVKAVGNAGGKTLYSAYDRTGMTAANRRYSNLSILMEGDSITSGFSTAKGGYAGVTYPQRIGQNLGCKINNRAVSGAVLGSPNRMQGNTVLYRLQSGAVKYSDYDVICIAIGTNDFADNITLGQKSDNENADTFYGYLNKTILLIRRQNPDADIVFITPFYRGRMASTIYHQHGYDFANGNGNTLRQYASAIKTVAGKYEGVYVYDSEKSNVINANNYLYACFDSLHPTQKYYGLIGNSITDFLTGLPAAHNKESRS